jgi:hypothetical protein
MVLGGALLLAVLALGTPTAFAAGGKATSQGYPCATAAGGAGSAGSVGSTGSCHKTSGVSAAAKTVKTVHAPAAPLRRSGVAGVLPFTGLQLGVVVAVALLLIGGGLLLRVSGRRSPGA